MICIGVTDFNNEAVAFEVASLDFVCVSVGGDDFDVVVAECCNISIVRYFEREGLACYGVFIFETSEADFFDGDGEVLSEYARDVGGSPKCFLYKEIQVLSGAGWLVERDFFYDEIMGVGFDLAFYTGHEWGEVCEAVDGHRL